jgi:CheY-like chemotaxis protein
MLEAGLWPDLLVTDHVMPGLSGLELARQFHVLRPDAKALIITGYAEDAPLDAPHLAKPFRRAELAASLAALVPNSG